jgi:sterol desaturase/sphingolipid hydroxylase (fatty acid hydroxylase superfamily)
MNNPISNSLRGIIIGAWIVGLIWFENRRALRPVYRSKLRRDVRNFVIAGPAGAVMQVFEMPVAFKLAEVTQNRMWGILPQLHLPRVVAIAAGILLLDYTLYWWHYLTHRVPALWRFHQVHHIDQEMDATTALRFHFGEMAISVPFRAAQIVAIGASPFTVAVWQVFLFLSILFHHSNVRLPLAFERILAHLVVTPRLHGIHHSIAPKEVNSNWSSGLTIWDWLHSTLRTEVPQSALTLGVPGFLGPSETAAAEALVLPFRVAGQPPAYDGAPVRQSVDALS